MSTLAFSLLGFLCFVLSFVHLFIYLFVFFLFIHLFIYLFIYLFINFLRGLDSKWPWKNYKEVTWSI